MAAQGRCVPSQQGTIIAEVVNRADWSLGEHILKSRAISGTEIYHLIVVTSLTHYQPIEKKNPRIPSIVIKE